VARARALEIKALVQDVVDRQLTAFSGEFADVRPTFDIAVVTKRLLDHIVGNVAMVIDMALDGGDIKGDDKTTDGYHTFKELYDHRITLYIALCRYVHEYEEFVWRSRLHADGTKFDGWFVLGIATSPGHQITYHLPDARWDDCNFADELERAPAFDGHTAADVLARLKKLTARTGL
jgi:hypothetical protein